MVLSRAAVSSFLARPRVDFSELKQLSEEKVDLALSRLKPRPRFHTKPYLHQKVCFLLGAKGSFFFMPDMGLGKSWVALNLARYHKKKFIVLVPGQSNIAAWTHEASVHAPSLHVVGFDEGSSSDWRKLLLEGDFDGVVCTYAGWLHLVCSKAAKGKKRRKRVMHVDPKKATELERIFGMVVLDESSYVKNHLSLFYAAARRLSKGKLTYPLSGSPFDKDPADLWTQFYVTDRGYALGETIGIFREAFCTATENYWSPFPDYSFDERKKPLLRKMMRHSSIRYKRKECMDLPPILGGVENGLSVRPVALDAEAWPYYDQLVQVGKDAADRLELKNSYLRLRQICSGFLPSEDENGETFVIRFQKQPKLEALVQTLSEIPRRDKVIIYNEFKTSGALIVERLTKEKVPHVRIFSGTSNKRDALRRFNDPRGPRVLVGSRAITFGLNLQAANWLIIYESPDSTIARSQLEARIVRGGQKKRMTIIDLATKGTVEFRILKGLVKGKDLFDQLVDNRQLLARK